MRKILILGATGQTGMLILNKLSHMLDVELIAYVRNVEKLISAETEGMTLIQGDIINTEALRKVMHEVDIVIASLSGD